MIYLSRLILNPRSRQVRNELADPYEMHRTVCKAFPDLIFKRNEPSGILFRVDVQPRTGIPALLVQSHHEPDWREITEPCKNYLLEDPFLPFGEENPAVKEVNLKLQTGQRLSFRLRANPTKRFSQSRKRIGLYKEKEQQDWLKRKLEAAGGVLISAQIANKSDLRGKLFVEKDSKKRMKFFAVQFEGILEVKDPVLFLKAVEAGIGSGKGLGFGLLSLASTRG